MVWLGIPIAIVVAAIGMPITIPAWEIMHEINVATTPDDQITSAAALRHLLDQVFLVAWVLIPGLLAFGGWFALVKKWGWSDN